MRGDAVVSLLRQYVPLATVVQIVVEALLLSTTVVLAIMLNPNHDGQVGAEAVILSMCFAGVVIPLNAAFGVYTYRADSRYFKIIALTALILLVGASAVYATSYLLPHGRRLQDVLGLAVIAALLGTSALHLFARLLFRRRSASHRVLIVGTGPEAAMVSHALAETRSREITVAGFYPVDGQVSPSIPARQVLADEPIDAAARRLKVSEIVVAVANQRGGVLPLRQLLDCRAYGLRVTNLSGFFERLRGEVPLDSLKASWLIYGEGFRQSDARTLVKRLSDILGSVILLTLAAPVMAVTALAILIESGAPVFYLQERVGRGGKLFRVIKFRSMRQDAERGGARWATRNDDRVTRVGRFLRRSRIDEIPQLFNVLMGDMSLVGPRPERPNFVEALTAEIPFYALRHSVKPGVTGWAQVRFHYGASVEDARRKLQYDLYYVKNNSFLLDIWILLETIRVVILGEGAQ